MVPSGQAETVRALIFVCSSIIKTGEARVVALLQAKIDELHKVSGHTPLRNVSLYKIPSARPCSR